MTLTTCAKRGALCAALFLALAAGKCDQTGVTYKVEELPTEFRQCADAVGVNIKDYQTGGKILWKDAQRLIVDLKAENVYLRRCQKSTVRWIDAQHAALNRYLGQ